MSNESGEVETEKTPLQRRRTFAEVMNVYGPDWHKIIRFFNRQSEGLSFIQAIATKLNLPPGIVLIFFIILVLVILGNGSGGSLICDLLGFLYPAYKSYKAVRSFEEAVRGFGLDGQSGQDGLDGQVGQETGQETGQEMLFWVKYWVVFSLGFIFNYFANALLFWVPFFYVLKLAFVVALLHPRIKGSNLIFKYLIAPLLAKYEASIDCVVDSAEKLAADAMKKCAVSAISEKIIGLATSSHATSSQTSSNQTSSSQASSSQASQPDQPAD